MTPSGNSLRDFSDGFPMHPQKKSRTQSWVLRKPSSDRQEANEERPGAIRAGWRALMARPRKIRPIHSKPTSGVGGRMFTSAESESLRDILEVYGLDGKIEAEVEAAATALLDRLHWLHASYQAECMAWGNQVGVADELRDLEAITADAKTVRQLLVEHADIEDGIGCIAPASSLVNRLRNFPNMVAAETTKTDRGVEFMHAQFRMIDTAGRVRYWPENRAQLVADIDLLIEVCATTPRPAGFTKRRNTARDRFERQLGELYAKELHPTRLELWRESRDERNDPPPPESRNAFARAVMGALRVPFEIKSRKG